MKTNSWAYCHVCFSICIIGISFCQAAHFDPVHQMTYCNSDATVQSTLEGPYSDPQDNWNPALGYLGVSSYQWIENASETSGQSNIEFQLYPFHDSYEDGSEPKINLIASSDSFTWLEEPDGVLADAWANAHTVAVGSATGNFYRILPDGNEQLGDYVIIKITYYGMVTLLYGDRTDSICQAWIGGGFAGDKLLITQNCQDYDNPQESEILHRFDKLELGEGTGGSIDEVASYRVNIGDIIGIHAAVGSHAGRTTVDDEPLNPHADLELSVIIDSFDGPGPFNPAKADLNGDGSVEMADLLMFASAWLWQQGESMTETIIIPFEDAGDPAEFNQRAMGGPASALWTWRGDQGVLGSGCLEPSNSTTNNTLVYTGKTVDMTIPGQTFTVSMMFKRWAAEYMGIDEAQVGFVYSDIQDFHTNSGPFMAVNLFAAGNNVLSMTIRYKEGIYSFEKPLASDIVLEAGHWYKLSAAFQRLASPTWRVTANLDDYGTDGGTRVSSVVADATNTFSNTTLYGDNEAYGAMSAERHDYSNGGTQYVDNFSMVFPPFDPMIADLSRNNKVDFEDFALFASAWLWQEAE